MQCVPLLTPLASPHNSHAACGLTFLACTAVALIFDSVGPRTLHAHRLAVIRGAHGMSINETAETAASLLRSLNVQFEDAACLSVEGRVIAAITLHSLEERDEALRILYRAGFDVTDGT
jgi:hypothetical protein